MQVDGDLWSRTSHEHKIENIYNIHWKIEQVILIESNGAIHLLLCDSFLLISYLY